MKVRGEKLRYAARDSLQCLPTVSPKSPVLGGAGRGYESEETKESDANEKGERTRETECVVFLADYCSSLLGSSERLKRKVDSKSRTICSLSLEFLRESMSSCIPDILNKLEAGEYTDIDEQHDGRLKWANSYAYNMFKIHSQRVDAAMEGFNHIYLSTAISKVGTEALGSRLRSLVIEFLITFCTKARLLSSTLHLAVSIMDRYLSKCSQSVECKPVKITHFLQIGLACLAIAVKLEERQPSFAALVAPLIAVWMVVFDDDAQFNATTSPDTEGKIKDTPSKSKKGAVGPVQNIPGLLSADEMAFVRRSLASRELKVLQTLDWELYSPTMFSFLGRYTIAAELSSNQADIAFCLSDRLLLAYTLLKYPPNLLAGAIVSLVRALSGKSSWTATLQHVTGLAIAHVHTCIEDIHTVLSLEQQERWASTSASTSTPAAAVAATTTTSPAPGVLLPDYVPGNSVRSKSQDYVYRALMTIPETAAGTGMPQVSPGAESDRNSGAGESSSKKRKTKVVGPGPKDEDKAMTGYTAKPRNKPITEASTVVKAGGGNSKADSGVMSTGGDERNTMMSASHRRDALAETSAAVMSALDKMNRRGRHPSYSPSSRRR
jgi:hypothetical protein